jgi:hypothetical protein
MQWSRKCDGGNQALHCQCHMHNLCGSAPSFGMFLRLADVTISETDDGQCNFDAMRSWAAGHGLPDGRALIVHANCDMCSMLRSNRSGIHFKYIIIGQLDENWGQAAGEIPGRTELGRGAPFIGCDDFDEHTDKVEDFVTTFTDWLDEPNLKMFLVNQGQVIAHPKLFTVPLGIKADKYESLLEFMKMGVQANAKRSRMLLINNSGEGMRKKLNDMVIENYGSATDGILKNTYLDLNQLHCNSTCCEKSPGQEPGLPICMEPAERRFCKAGFRCYAYAQFLTHKFVFCPPGAGYDSYRIWEALYLGAIPVVEKQAGYQDIFRDLPVLELESFEQITPELLDREYKRIQDNIEEYDFTRLTSRHWLDLVMQAARGRPCRLAVADTCYLPSDPLPCAACS